MTDQGGLRDLRIGHRREDRQRIRLTIPNLGFIMPNMGISSSFDPAVVEPVGLADALFGRVRRRVLALLFGNPDRSYYTNEIIAWVDAGSGAVQRELARLTTAGLLTVSRVGRQKHYQANEAAPIFPELHGIVLKTYGLGDVLRTALSPLEHDIRAAFVFGSIAKGVDTASSDVDLMVISDRATYAELYGMLEKGASQLARPVNPTIYTSSEFTQRVRDRNPFLAKVLGEPRIWVIGGEDDLAP